jgi:hypothetical protein
MKVTVGFEVPDEDVLRLQTSLGASTNLSQVVDAILKAGAKEFLDQATGRVVPGGIREARLYRIFLLLQSGVTLSDVQVIVAAIFKETPSRARSLVESAIARYDIELRESVDQRVAEILKKATWIEGHWELELPNGFVRDRILEAASKTTFADPTRAGRGVIYKFPHETYNAVRKSFGLPASPKPKN